MKQSKNDIFALRVEKDHRMGFFDSVYWVGSSKHNNEQAYLMRKFVSFWGSTVTERRGGRDRPRGSARLVSG